MRFLRMSSTAVLAAAIAGLVSLGPAALASAAPGVPAGDADAPSSAPSMSDDLVAPGIFRVISVEPGQGSTRGGFALTLVGSGFLPRIITVTICGARFTSDGGGVQIDQTGHRATFTAPPCVAGPTEIAVQSADIIRRVTFRYVDTELPVTGSSAKVLLTTGTAMVAVGVVPVFLFRRRRPTAPSSVA